MTTQRPTFYQLPEMIRDHGIELVELVDRLTWLLWELKTLELSFDETIANDLTLKNEQMRKTARLKLQMNNAQWGDLKDQTENLSKERKLLEIKIEYYKNLFEFYNLKG